MQPHPEFGANPTQHVCFWCGEPQEIVLLGDQFPGKAPDRSIVHTAPCNACKKELLQKRWFIEVVPYNPAYNRPQVQPGIFASGRKIEATPELLGAIPIDQQTHAVFLEEALFEMLLAPESRKEKKDEV